MLYFCDIHTVLSRVEQTLWKCFILSLTGAHRAKMSWIKVPQKKSKPNKKELLMYKLKLITCNQTLYT